MKLHIYLLVAIMLIGTASSGLACLTCAPCTGSELNSEQMAAIVKSKAAIVVDARGTKAQKAHIPGAKALSSQSSAEEIKKNLPDKNAEIVTYCTSTSCGASAALAGKLREMGYKNVREYPEGIKGWQDAGNKVESEM
ncbi:MAG: rhodanese-like domain-containing protein [Kiritimatiellales bacterium]|nr:rhodanese-like domain-containing protein [Kiritimatiellales bacterium]